MVIMSECCTSHGLNLAAIHEQGKWQHHFQCVLAMREGGKAFLWLNLVWLSDTGVWDDRERGCHIIVRIGIRVMLIVIVYSAVIVVMMKIAQKGYRDFLSRISEVR